MGIASDGIAARMADHYTRQIAWIETSLVALDAILASSLGDNDWDAIVEEDRRRAEQLKSLESEYAALKKEWDATPAFRPEERNHVRDLERNARDRGAEFQTRLEKVLAKFRDAGGEMKEELGALRKGRDVARKFTAGQSSGGGHVDRRA